MYSAHYFDPKNEQRFGRILACVRVRLAEVRIEHSLQVGIVYG